MSNKINGLKTILINYCMTHPLRVILVFALSILWRGLCSIDNTPSFVAYLINAAYLLVFGLIIFWDDKWLY